MSAPQLPPKYVLLRFEFEKDIPDIAKFSAQYAWNIEGVKNCFVVEGADKIIVEGPATDRLSVVGPTVNTRRIPHFALSPEQQSLLRNIESDSLGFPTGGCVRHSNVATPDRNDRDGMRGEFIPAPPYPRTEPDHFWTSLIKLFK